MCVGDQHVFSWLTPTGSMATLEQLAVGPPVGIYCLCGLLMIDANGLPADAAGWAVLEAMATLPPKAGT